MPELNPTSSYHNIILELMHKLGYPPDDGMCHGLAMMGLQACVVGEIDEFNNRLAYIAEHDDLLTAIKSKNPSQEIIDVMAFLDGVSLHQGPGQHMEVFGRHFSQRQFNAALAFTASHKLEKKFGINKIMHSQGIYTDEELNRYCYLINKIAIKNKQPFSLLLGGSGHAIALYYDPRISSWYGVNANQFPISVIKIDLAQWIKKALLEESNFTAFTARILTLGNSPKASMQLYHAITKPTFSKKLDKLHQLTAERARYENSSGVTLAYLAAHEGNIDMVKKLYAVNADVNKSTDQGVTVLFVAAEEGHADLVRYLHSVGADVNKGMNNGMTPAISAAQWGHLDVLRVLALAGADLAQRTKAKTPLKVAKSNRRQDCIQFLESYLKEKYGVNHSAFFATPAEPKKHKRKVIYRLARE